MSKNLIIAIDGFSACGKSTLAKDLAKSLHLIYIDSGAIYRAICLYCIEHNIHPEDISNVIEHLTNIQIDIDFRDGLQIIMNNENVNEAIRKPEISRWVSEIAVIPEVRKKVNLILRKFGNEHSLVMDGRDIGTVVFADARYKFFITADIQIRAQRRQKELIEKGRDINLNDVMDNLVHRDYIDSNREDSPLRKAEDAILIDNSHLSPDQQLQRVLEIIHSK